LSVSENEKLKLPYIQFTTQQEQPLILSGLEQVVPGFLIQGKYSEAVGGGEEWRDFGFKIKPVTFAYLTDENRLLEAEHPYFFTVFPRAQACAVTADIVSDTQIHDLIQ
jgi:hypothetical protein